MPTGQARQLERLVEQVAVRRQEGDLLQRDDVRVQGDDLRRDPLEPLAADVPPPGGRERLARADRGRMFQVATRTVGGANASPRLLDGPGQQSLDEVALEAEEHE